jgi:hypothetical protein
MPSPTTATIVLRSLLLLERSRKRDVFKRRGKPPLIHDACFCRDCGIGQRFGSSHFGVCHVDRALNALGYLTSKSRDSARKRLRITEPNEWPTGKPELRKAIRTP